MIPNFDELMKRAVEQFGMTVLLLGGILLVGIGLYLLWEKIKDDWEDKKRGKYK